MLNGLGRHRLTNTGFAKRSSLGEPTMAGRVGSARGMSEERSAFFGPGGNAGYLGNQGGGGGSYVPDSTTLRSFAKPSNVGLGVGLVPVDPHMLIMLAREMYDNDAIAGAVVDTMAEIPFGAFSLSG